MATTLPELLLLLKLVFIDAGVTVGVAVGGVVGFWEAIGTPANEDDEEVRNDVGEFEESDFKVQLWLRFISLEYWSFLRGLEAAKPHGRN